MLGVSFLRSNSWSWNGNTEKDVLALYSVIIAERWMRKRDSRWKWKRVWWIWGDLDNQDWLSPASSQSLISQLSFLISYLTYHISHLLSLGRPSCTLHSTFPWFQVYYSIESQFPLCLPSSLPSPDWTPLLDCLGLSTSLNLIDAASKYARDMALFCLWCELHWSHNCSHHVHIIITTERICKHPCLLPPIVSLSPRDRHLPEHHWVCIITATKYVTIFASLDAPGSHEHYPKVLHLPSGMTASKCICDVIQSLSRRESFSSVSRSLKVYCHTCTNTASDVTWSWYPSPCLSLLDYCMQVHLSIHSISASKCLNWFQLITASIRECLRACTVAACQVISKSMQSGSEGSILIVLEYPLEPDWSCQTILVELDQYNIIY